MQEMKEGVLLDIPAIRRQFGVTSAMPAKPQPAHEACEQTFLKCMDECFNERGLSVSPALKKVWSGIFKALEEVRTCHDPTSRHLVVPAPTGTGKSTALGVYMSHSLPQGEGALVVMPFVEQIREMAQSICEAAGWDKAVAYHSKSPLKGRLKTLSKYPVLLITHEQYKRLLRDKDGQQGAFWHHGEKPRMLVLDEWLDTHDSYTLRRAHFHWLQTLCAQLGGPLSFVDVWEAPWDELLDAVRQWSLERLHQAVEEAPERWLPWCTERTLPQLKAHFNDTLRALMKLGHQDVVFCAPEAQDEGLKVSMPLKMHRKGVILDATGSLEPQYQSSVYALKPLPNPRRYTRLKIKLFSISHDGKNALDKALSSSDAMSAFTQRLSDVLALGWNERALCVTHKSLRRRLEKEGILPHGVTLAHYGDLVGKNGYAGLHKGIFVGLPYQPGYLFEQLEGVSSKEAQYQRALAHLIQAINRLSIRKGVDAEGECASAEVCLVMRETEALKKVLKQHLPGCSLEVHPWGLEMSVPRPGPTSEAQRKLLAHLEAEKPKGTMALKKLMVACGLSRGEENTIRRHLNALHSAFKQALEDRGYLALKRGRAWYLQK